MAFKLRANIWRNRALDLDALDKEDKAARRKIHETIAKVTTDMGQRQTYNTAIAAIMELLNTLNKLGKNNEQSRAVAREGVEAIVLMLSPITPHIANELWVAFGHTDSVLDAQWPEVDEAALVKDSIEMVVQVNGKVRAKLELPANVSKEDAEAIARADENVIKFVGESTIRKVIVIPGKLVNIVAN